MLTKELIRKRLEAFEDILPYCQDSDTIVFTARGCDINNPFYKGDIFNHRIVALLQLNGLKIVIEATATRTRRTLHKVTKKPLLHPIEIYDDNGLHIDYSVEDVPTFEKSGYFGYHLYPLSFHTGSDWIKDNMKEGTSAHTIKNLLLLINSELKTHFKKVVILDRGYDSYLTVSEALKDNYIRNFDKKPLAVGEFETLKERARNRFNMLKWCSLGLIPSNKDFDSEAVWITSSDLQGFYFPNMQEIRCISFGVYGRVITCVDDEEEQNNEKN